MINGGKAKQLSPEEEVGQIAVLIIILKNMTLNSLPGCPQAQSNQLRELNWLYHAGHHVELTVRAPAKH